MDSSVVTLRRFGVGLTLPPGNYVVWSAVDFYNDNNNRNDQYFATLMTTVTLTASENQILVYCSPGGGKGYANGRIIAMAVDAID